ncbi:MAG TPA: AAA family ATPase [Dongiaceae bacterium]|nr:AAA family ATPase [Dongiaceae bacterium]
MALTENTTAQKAAGSLKPRSAERRQVTALSYDLVGSTRLAAQLDPEDLRSLQRLFHETCSNAIARYEGYISHYTGDGAMAFFGYPKAHEDDPERAVRAGLAILAECRKLNEQQRSPEIPIALRVGIATGLVVAGDFAGDRAFDQDDIVGIAPNLAYKIQAAALPNSVQISSVTRELTAGLFQCRAQPPLIIPGLNQPQPVWQVLRARARNSRSWSARLPSITPLVSRDEEVAILMRRWELAEAGEGQVALLSGEPGIGKSRIAATIKDHVAQRRHFTVTLQCSSQETDTAFHPIIRLLEQISGASSASADFLSERFGKVLGEPKEALSNIVPYLARLLDRSDDDNNFPANLGPEQIKQRTMAAVIKLLEHASLQRPVLLICEDIHWIDPTSEELLSLLIDRVNRLRVMMLITFRPSYQVPWVGQPHVTLVALNRLSDRYSFTMVRYLARNHSVTQATIDRIVALSDGVPLFIEELSRTVFHVGSDQSQNATGSAGEAGSTGIALAAEPTIPATLSDSLAARLDQLGAGREIAQICSVIGRSFDAELVCKMAGQDEAEVAHSLEGLVASGLASRLGRPPHATYTFRHALIQESAYRSMLRASRQAIHRRLADILATDYGDVSDGAPEILAHHYEEAGAATEAIQYLHQAARNAVAHSANIEAVRLLDRALRLLATLPESETRNLSELSLLVSLGPPRLGISGPGAPEVQALYARAIELCSKLPNSPDHFVAHWGWWFTSKDNREALDRANRLVSLAFSLEDDELALQAHHCQWATQFSIGDHLRTSQHIESGLKIYERGDFRLHSTRFGGHDPKSCALGELALSLWLTGDYDRSLRSMEQAVAHAEALQQSGSIRHSRDQQIMLHRYRGDADKVLRLAEAMADYAEDQGFKGLAAQAKVFRGWAVAKLGDADRGVGLLVDGLAEHMEINTPEDLPVYYEMVAEAYGVKGAPESGLPLLIEAETVADRTGLLTWSAELCRRKGALLLQQSRHNMAEARACFARAIAIAQSQGARALLLRALCDDIRSGTDDERPQARAALAALCDSLTEGRDYVDVIMARRLLDEAR